jgi:hypothetical protein
VISNNRSGGRQINLQSSFKLFFAQERALAQVIERWRPSAMHAPWLLAHRYNAFSCTHSGSEMDMAHLGEGIADGIVHSTSTDFATFYMGDRYTQGKSYRCRSKHLVPICNKQQRLWSHRAETIGE